MAQPLIGLLALGFSRLDQTVKLSAGRRAVGRVAEQPVFAPDHEGPDRTLCRVVADMFLKFDHQLRLIIWFAVQCDAPQKRLALGAVERPFIAHHDATRADHRFR